MLGHLAMKAAEHIIYIQYIYICVKFLALDVGGWDRE